MAPEPQGSEHTMQSMVELPVSLSLLGALHAVHLSPLVLWMGTAHSMHMTMCPQGSLM
eukprot:CAMPEP_0182582924 /NCGR_PEP_ID=MMETSP1324-20130603/53849_1 /TAXON_ID=236786 /ORGANISM="Florenciella sp., Strain RCC1587" /LENGTH=57 /DNA_ID=CAMNT_0024799435 /DNA_START=102 /DNA_END=272 /DNA_ORIENTATION=-